MLYYAFGSSCFLRNGPGYMIKQAVSLKGSYAMDCDVLSKNGYDRKAER